ncbi:hypothetical protein Lepto7375DRAFT_1816 [Leptolyngbya sp. PCC 7375]|nr:hypothetical protein Lepto7375DRAFT_1816 [Leptolyngbya sp. PCC 7375]
MIIFHISEIMARYKVSVTALSTELSVTKSTVSQWRQGNHSPSLDRVNDIMCAVLKLGDEERLKISPLHLRDVLEWRSDDNKV